MDQLDDPLPENVPAHEVFTTATVWDYVGSNWPGWTPLGNTTNGASSWTPSADQLISVTGACAGCDTAYGNPGRYSYRSDLAGRSTTSGSGVAVQTESFGLWLALGSTPRLHHRLKIDYLSIEVSGRGHYGSSA
jgi:hypothetical protein